MFRIKMVDIIGSQELLECTTTVDTLCEAEIIAQGAVCRIYGLTRVKLVHDEELVYEVYNNGVSVGVVAIESL